jgi:hypothetical protein
MTPTACTTGRTTVTYEVETQNGYDYECQNERWQKIMINDYTGMMTSAKCSGCGCKLTTETSMKTYRKTMPRQLCLQRRRQRVKKVEDGSRRSSTHRRAVWFVYADADEQQQDIGQHSDTRREDYRNKGLLLCTESEGNPNEFAANYYFSKHLTITTSGSVTTLLKTRCDVGTGYTYDEFATARRSARQLADNEISYNGSDQRQYRRDWRTWNARYYNPVIGRSQVRIHITAVHTVHRTQHLYSTRGGIRLTLLIPTGHRL